MGAVAESKIPAASRAWVKPDLHLSACNTLSRPILKDAKRPRNLKD